MFCFNLRKYKSHLLKYKIICIYSFKVRECAYEPLYTQDKHILEAAWVESVSQPFNQSEKVKCVKNVLKFDEDSPTEADEYFYKLVKDQNVKEGEDFESGEFYFS